MTIVSAFGLRGNEVLRLILPVTAHRARSSPDPQIGVNRGLLGADSLGVWVFVLHVDRAGGPSMSNHSAEGGRRAPKQRLTDLVGSQPTLADLSAFAEEAGNSELGSRPRFLVKLAEVNKELWLILSMLVIGAVLNYLVTGHRVVLSLYVLPTMFSAYFYGRRHAMLTAVASIVLVAFLTYTKPNLFGSGQAASLTPSYWFDIAAWGGILVVMGAAMGSLHERHERRLRELRQTYHGLLLLLRQFVSKDQQTESHCYRVSVYAAKIASYMGLTQDRIEDVRAASLLHDVGKVGVTRTLLQKAAQLSEEERARGTADGKSPEISIATAGGLLRRIIPIVLAHVDKLDSDGKRPAEYEDLPLEARIISVADVYDSLTSDHAYRKAMSPFEAKGIIVRCAGTEFDPRVVEGFQRAFKNAELEVRTLAA
ncbi:MAG: HD domain-containing protein [Candidatus Eisenbacteria bacterium]|nr:HD domain-containing protein [Candidatus Eisenbacteria bacterium]